MRRKDLLNALAAAGLLLVTACSAEASSPGAPDPATSGIRTELTGAEKDLLNDAEQRLITDCMRGEGFSYTVDPPPPNRSRAPDRPFGLDDVAWARRHGYGLAADGRSGDRGGAAQTPAGSQERYLASLTPERRLAFDRALNGTDREAIVVEVPGRGQILTSADGCQAEARSRLYGDLHRWTEAKAIVVNLGYITWDQVVSEPGYTKALEGWRDCMAARGLPYRSSSEAIGDVASRRPQHTGESARKREMRTAVADAECNRDAGLSRTGTRLLREHVQAAARKKFARQARHYTDAVTSALARARTVARPE
ncbi:hypothetical protein ACLGIH_01690 [Streptomyces sp. HMX87]|uniref:hypothetical protein n=1 Tax=Streptomyces sp. HMX87 TaxID=3390849 RepID=UPI003A86BD4E